MSVLVKIDRGPVADLKKPWQSRNRTDRSVTGAVELAYLRGVHAGYVQGYRDRKKGKKPRFK